MSEFRTLAALSLSLALLPACVPSETGSDDGDAAPKDDGRIVATDDGKTGDEPAAVEALSKVATELKRDGEGFVIEVNFRGAEIDDSAPAHLSGLKRVRSVLLNDTAVTDAGLEPIGKISTLANLDLRGCGVSNAGIAHLTGLKGLRALRLGGVDTTSTVDDVAMDDIAKLTSLKALALDFLWVGEETALAKLAGLKDLEELYMAETLIGDEGLAVLGQFPKLKKLRISRTQIGDAGLAHLSKISTLADLDVSECANLSDDGLAHLAGMTQMKRLNLWREQITDAGAAHLAGMINMEWLNVDNTQLTDAGLESFNNMKKLKFLHLGSTAVSDAGLVHLEHLTSLEDLKVTRTAVTAEGVEQLKEKLPNTEIQLLYLGGEQ